MSWEQIRLRDIGRWYGGGTPAKSNAQYWSDGTIPWLSPKDMGTDVLAGTQDLINAAAIGATAVKLVPQNAVAVVVRSGILERTVPVALVPFETTLNQDMKAVVARDGVDPRWIAWGLRAFEGRLLAETRKTGTTVASMDMTRFLGFELPVPPLDEQRRILTILGDQLSRVDAADRSFALVEQRLDALRASTLAELLANSGSLGETVPLGDLGAIGTGGTPSRSMSSFYDGGKIPWVTSGDLSGGLIAGSKQYVTEAGRAAARLKRFPPGTLLVAMYGEGKTRGTVAQLAIEATINQACAAIQLNDASLYPWVRAVLEANYLTMRSMAAGGVQPNLNLRLVRSIPVPVPAAADRDRLLRRMEQIGNADRGLRGPLATSRRRSTAIRRSLLAAAFSGRLSAASSKELTLA